MNRLSHLIPGYRNPSLKRKFFPDLIYFLFLVAFPSSFFAFVPTDLFYDIRLVYWIIGMLYGILYIKYLKKIGRLVGGKLLILLVVFLIFRFLYSLIIDQIPLTEVITIFRTNFFYPIAALGFLLYAASMDNERIYRFFYWLILVMLILGVLYLFSNLTGKNIYAVISKEEFANFKGQLLLQNLSALPRYHVILYVFGIFTVFTSKKSKYHFYWIIPFTFTVISIVRNQIIVYIIIMVLFFIIGNLYIKEIKLAKTIKFIVIAFLAIVLLAIVFSSHVGRVLNKFGLDQSNVEFIASNIEGGNYDFRIRLIEESYTRTKQNGNLLLGNGYTREAGKGGYDFVLGGDTLIAPVLFTEGFSGLILRVLPLFYFLFFGLKHLKSKFQLLKYFSFMMVIILIPEIINIVQTSLFVLYTEILFIFYLFMMIIYNNKRNPSVELNNL